MKKLQLNKFGLSALAFGFWLVFQLVIVIGIATPVLALCLALGVIALSFYFAYGFGLLEKGQSIFTKEGVKTLGLGLLTSWFVKGLGSVLLALSNESSTYNQDLLENVNIPLYFLYFFAVFLAPVVEEFVFRGLLMGKIFGRYSSLGLIISSLLFALTHLPTNLGSWVLYGGMGLVLGYYYRKTGRLDYVIGIHLLNNLLAALIMVLA